MRLIVSPDARRDLKGIARYGEREWGRERRDDYLAMLRARFGALLDYPDIGAPRSDLIAGSRSVPAGRHVIFYSVSQETIRILRVLHQRMDARLYF
jgi:toxin ParE1/3/4